MLIEPGMKLLERYVVGERLGAGSMGLVYRAKDLRLGRAVALKVLPGEMTRDADAYQRFEREARALAQLTHPNILVLHDFVTDQGITFAVTELLEGETLRARMLHAPLPPQECIVFGLMLAEGLAAAHAKGIIHRDLKPENIFLTAGGGLKILDFGLARLVRRPAPVTGSADTVSIETRPGMIVGSLGYMAPEQLRGQPADVRSDLFSFGCVLYEMACGARPFPGHTAADIIASVLKEEPADPLRLKPGLPSELASLIRRCLPKTPDTRLQSAHEAAERLKVLLSITSTVRLEKPAAAADPAPRRRAPGRRLALAVAVLAGVALLAGWWVLRRSATARIAAAIETDAISAPDLSPASSQAAPPALSSDAAPSATLICAFSAVSGGGAYRVLRGGEELFRVVINEKKPEGVNWPLSLPAGKHSLSFVYQDKSGVEKARSTEKLVLTAGQKKSVKIAYHRFMRKVTVQG